MPGTTWVERSIDGRRAGSRSVPVLAIDVVGAATPEVLEDVMTAAEKLRKVVEARGEARGRLAARRGDVIRLLRARFPGQVSERLEARVRSADDATLEAWFERGLSATTLEDAITD